MDTITVSARIDFWTHYRASRAVVARIWSTYAAWAFFCGVPAGLLVFMVGSHRDITAPGAFGWPAWMLPVVGFLFMAVLMPLLTMFNIYSFRRRNPTIGTQTWVLAPECFSVSGNLFNTSLKWDAFTKARETRRFFLLFVSPRSVHFVPKSAIVSRKELFAIRALIQQKLGAKARLGNET
jgi:hypothetical protein